MKVLSVTGISLMLLGQSAAVAADAAAGSDEAAIHAAVAQLDLGRYKDTIRGLTRFGDRREATARNRAALDWIETQLRAYGCGDVERLTYQYAPPPPRVPQSGQSTSAPPRTPGAALPPDAAVGGGRYRGVRAPTSVNRDPLRQEDAALRELNAEPSVPGERQQVYCTKRGSLRPDEMYIVGAHMDGHGWGEAANDDASGTALVMELARILSSPEFRTERSIRFMLWNNEETGLNGSKAYVEQRAALQGIESPPGPGRYPEPRWLGMIQHDMMLFDHGMPRRDGKVAANQRSEADINIEFQSRSRLAEGSQRLAWAFHAANAVFASDYPAVVGPHMTNTDSVPFQDLVPAISLREAERGREIGAGWDPHWHQPSDLFVTFSDDDFRLGLNAAQTTLGALGRLAGLSLAAERLAPSR